MKTLRTIAAALLIAGSALTLNAAPAHEWGGIKRTLEYTLDGRPPVTLKAGEALFIPNGTPHTAKNVGTGKAVELATYVVEKGKPLVAQSK